LWRFVFLVGFRQPNAMFGVTVSLKPQHAELLSASCGTLKEKAAFLNSAAQTTFAIG
jgi:hypothetical protein